MLQLGLNEDALEKYFYCLSFSFFFDTIFIHLYYQGTS